MDEIAREQAALAVCIDKCSFEPRRWLVPACFHIDAFAELEQLLARRNAIVHVLKGGSEGMAVSAGARQRRAEYSPRWLDQMVASLSANLTRGCMQRHIIDTVG